MTAIQDYLEILDQKSYPVTMTMAGLKAAKDIIIVSGGYLRIS